MTEWSNLVRQFYVEGFKTHYSYVVSTPGDLELWEYLESLGMVIEDDIIMEYFLNITNLKLFHYPERRQAIPQAALDAYDFYWEGGDQVTVSRILVQERPTYGVKVTTDGDSGWLEVFDEQGQLIGAALTWLDVIGWGEQRRLRQQYTTKTYRADLPRLHQLSVYYPPRS